MPSLDAAVANGLRRLPGGARIAKLQNRAASFAEQGLQGAANLLVNVILARNLTEAGFATIGLLIGIHFFVLGLHRTILVLPFILDASGSEEEAAAAERRWWWANLLSIVAIAILMAIVAIAARVVAADQRFEWARQAIELAVVVTPALLLFEFGRRVLYQRRLPLTAALASACYMILNLGAAWLLTRDHPSAMLGGMAWVIAGLGGWLIATIAAPPGRPQLRSALGVWWQHREFAFWQGLTTLPYAVYNSSVAIVIGLFGGPAAVAGFAAARTLTNPAISMVTAVDSLDKPRAARALAADGIAGLGRSIASTRRLLAVLCGLYLGALILFAGPVLRLAFGDTYTDQVNEVRILAFAFFLICMNQPSETFIIVVRQSKLLLATRIVAAITAVASLALAAPYGLMGTAVALLLTHALNLGNLRLAERVAVSRWRRSKSIDAEVDGAVKVA
jgi:O-antigen/teichoic acid export membrane protein